MTTHLVKHRYLDGGEPGAACTEQIPGYGQCGLSEYATFHWHDGSHPFTGDAGEPCTWVERSGEMCHGQVQNAEHQEAVELEKALDGNHGGVWRVAPVRVPDENGERVAVGGGGARTVSAQVPMTANIAKAFGTRVMAEPTRGERYRAGGLVEPGPWPVRQFVIFNRKDAARYRDELVRLLGLEVAFDAYVWWSNGVRVSRVVWGSLLGVNEEEVARQLDEWV